ncbi:MAG: hypothetical protein ABUL60_03825 [Myxococcales bacterium]
MSKIRCHALVAGQGQVLRAEDDEAKGDGPAGAGSENDSTLRT